MRTPQRAILKRSNARSCFEPRRSRDPTDGRFARKPTNGGKAFWRPPTGPRDATSNTRASASDPHSGQSVGVESTLVRRGLRLEYATLSWNVVGVPLLAVAAIRSGSAAAAGFGGYRDPAAPPWFVGLEEGTVPINQICAPWRESSPGVAEWMVASDVRSYAH